MALEPWKEASFRFLASPSAEASSEKNKGNDLLLHHVERQDFNAVARVLADDGAQINAVNRAGESALHIATKTGNVHLVELLTTYKPNLNLLSKKETGGLSALHFACRMDHLEVAKALVKAGANVNIQSVPHGATPLIDAAKLGCARIIKFLLMKGRAMWSCARFL